MRKIKLAICISGEPRLYYRLLKSIKSLDKEAFDVDVFYHLWDNVTKRQKNINEEPIIESINSTVIMDKFQPKAGICESKDILDQELITIKQYTQKLIKEYSETKKHKINEYSNILLNEEELSKHLKFTNWPWYSQLYSLCKSQMIRINYEIENNIQYDFIIRTRTDVEITCTKLKSLYRELELREEHGLESNKCNYHKVYFPHMYLKGSQKMHNRKKFNTIGVRKEHLFSPVHVEYCYYIGTPKSMGKLIYENYKQDIVEYMVQAKEGEKEFVIYQPTSHTFIPHLILKNSTNLELRCGNGGFKYKLEQLPKLF